MQLPLPDAPDPPSIGQIIVYAFYGVGAAIAVIFGGRGFMQGRSVGEPGTDRAEIAGAVISDKKADAIIDAITKQTAAMIEEAASNKAMVASNGMLTIAVDKNTATLDRATEDLGEARQEMRELTREIVRMGRT